MPKNIVLCSDGTGNKGGSGSDTNVFKIYNAVRINDIPDNKRQQVVFYDNGVGTSKLGLLKALGGGLGLGFRQNVRDLYEFLGRHYTGSEDHVYIFGFSRGAATVRAFAGMVEYCGLVVKHPRDVDGGLDEEVFQDRIDAVMRHYANRGGRWSIRKLLRSVQELFRQTPAFERESTIKIEFMGIWDTVAALGAPQLPLFDHVLNFIRRHKFYDLEPATCVRNVYHAMAVDDERRTFWPKVWNEATFKGGGTIEQVWFSGMHSNVGGGYPRDELANVTLDWMMERLNEHRDALSGSDPSGGLLLKPETKRDARADANPFGKVYDSRSGFNIFYRYQPRPIEDLCSVAKTLVRIHESVLDRLELRTAGYTPGNLPAKFHVAVTPAGPLSPADADASRVGSGARQDAESYSSFRARLDSFKNSRIGLYWTFLMSSLAVVAASGVLWIRGADRPPIDCCWPELSTAQSWLVDILRYVLPTFFDGAITYLAIEHPVRFAILVSYAILLYCLRVSHQIEMEALQGNARLVMLSAMGRRT
ncbi:MAG: DUF2235 domain-containing protein [Vicinamibacterales bacterium]|jgi:uncharacterized protein (DUF2235 family)|nr:DUF2235 domain-containing protein [Vicinamibacterales bacterium]HJN45030.1 DUF2235 domain-containing protein [Vicinamibacterales bacterium]